MGGVSMINDMNQKKSGIFLLVDLDQVMLINLLE